VKVLVGSSEHEYDFTFAEALGRPFAVSLARDFKAAYSKLSVSSSDPGFRELRDLLVWLGDSDAKHPEVIQRILQQLRDAMQAGTAAAFSEDLYTQACEHYAERFRQPERAADFADPAFRLWALRRVLRKLSSKNALPRLSSGLQPPKRRHYSEGGRCPLGALTKSGPVAPKSSGALEAALEEVLRGSTQKPDLVTFDGRMRAVEALNRARLDRLRLLLEQELAVERDAFELGLALMSLPGMPSDADIAHSMEYAGFHRQQRHKWFHKVVGCDLSLGMGILLRYLKMQGPVIEGKLPPALAEFARRKDVREKFHIPAGQLTKALQRLLSITFTSWNAAFGLLLIDTAWNPAPLLTLPVEPWIGTIVHGQRSLGTAHVIGALKKRARHEVLAALMELPKPLRHMMSTFGPDYVTTLDAQPRPGISGYEAILLVQRMTAPLRASSQQPGHLWLAPLQHSGTAVPSIAAYQREWERFLERHADDPVIGNLPIRHSMIRKTRLDIIAMSGPSGSAEAIRTGQHHPKVAMKHYQNSPEFLHAIHEHIRVFQNAFETVLAQDIRGAAKKLGITASTWHSRLTFALDSGLGIFSLKKGVSAPPVTAPTISFAPSKAALLRLHVVDLTLSQKGTALAAQSAERWWTTWYPLLVRTRAVIRALEGTTSAKLSRLARREVANGLR
jgi:hypothetical protein